MFVCILSFLLPQRKELLKKAHFESKRVQERSEIQKRVVAKSVEGFSREFVLGIGTVSKSNLAMSVDRLNAALLIGQSQDLNIRSRALYLSRFK